MEPLDHTEDHFSETKIDEGEFSSDKPISVAGEDSEATIRRVLSAYELGKKLRQLRLKKKIALVDLGKHTGLSASMLSQLENGKLVPTLPTLARIAMVFDVGLDHFFGDKRREKMFAIVRAHERIQFPEKPDINNPAYFFEVLAFNVQDKSIQAYLAEFPSLDNGAKNQEHSHEGSELVLVLAGKIAIHFQDEDHVLDTGDSAYFDASEPHSYRGLSSPPARVIVITTPPRP